MMQVSRLQTAHNFRHAIDITITAVPNLIQLRKTHKDVNHSSPVKTAHVRLFVILSDFLHVMNVWLQGKLEGAVFPA